LNFDPWGLGFGIGGYFYLFTFIFCLSICEERSEERSNVSFLFISLRAAAQGEKRE
jgi:hypothetical protein